MRVAECRCGAVKVACEGEPVRVSVCHCLNCKRRSGSAFAVQARWPEEQVTLTGETREWQQAGDSGRVGRFRFCPVCGATIAFTIDAMPGTVAVPVGAFADPDFAPWPRVSVYEARMCPWVEIKGDPERWD
ncbi:MAG: GFA family protein [Sphingomonadales bacterium]|nr:MAG: GFA family protein [Sphingomonadales bacterium]